jgi:6-pyruvoyltetrahydropterin/6-carboxytetrahydropterin synthase
MFAISVDTQFQASHRLVLADGSKEPVHSHNWSVTADVSSDRLNSMGLVMDFNQLRAMIDNIVAEFSGKRLDKNNYFQRHNPSAENVAKYIYEKLEPALPEGVRLHQIKVVEEAGCRAKFGEPC